MTDPRKLSVPALKRYVKKERDQLKSLESEVRELQAEEVFLSTDLEDESCALPELKPQSSSEGAVGSEWKTRFESQEEYNNKLSEQLASFKEKLATEKDKLVTIQSGGELDFLKGGNIHKTLIRLKREKKSLECQLKDLEWRLDREAREYHKADEKRKALLTEHQNPHTTDSTRPKDAAKTAAKTYKGKHENKKKNLAKSKNKRSTGK